MTLSRPPITHPESESPEPKILLSAALIVRDEERHLEACLESIRDLVDEIVVVDTGSVDRSIEIAESRGARVFHYRWHDDFAAARNHGLERCRGRWILYIDADERARPLSRPELAAVLGEENLIGVSVWLHAQTGYSPYREMRLFRNDPRIRFEGLMHETIWPGIERFAAEEGGEIGRSELVLDHVGYDGPQDHKYERNLPLLLAALERDPKHIYCWYHLGMTHLGLDQPDLARDAWRSGIEAARRASSLRPADSLPFIELIQHEMNRGEEVDTLITDGQRLFPEDPMLRWLEGRMLMERGQLEEAVALLDSLVVDHEAGRLGTDFGYDQRQFTSFTQSLIGNCCYRLGRYGEGKDRFTLALQQEPQSLEYRTKRDLCAHLDRTACQ